MLLGKILYAIVVMSIEIHASSSCKSNSNLPLYLYLIQMLHPVRFMSDLSFETGKNFNLIGRGQRSLLPIHISYRIHNKSETHVK